MNAAIANKLNVLESAIIRVEEWANVLFVVVKGLGARFVSKKVVEEKKMERKLIKAEWSVGAIKCKAEYKEERAFFNGQPCFATYKEVVKKFVGKPSVASWELVQNVDATKFLESLPQFPSDAVFTYA